MPGFVPDTSCMVAAACAWHSHHEQAVDELERRLDRGEPMLLAAPALIETYAVLTRLPPPHRVSPADTLTLLEANFMDLGQSIALEPDGYRTLLRAAPERGVSGGRTYDAVIAACAVRGRASVLLTFNASHFVSLRIDALEIVVPRSVTG
jgi:predicted nucleic acid-binding protein